MTPVTGYVYLISNLVNGKQYVGCTSWTVQRRWKRHLTMAKAGSEHLIHKAIRKHGEGNFSLECLETISGTRADLLIAERGHIARLNCLAPLGYNLTPGGTGVDHSRPEFRAVYLAAMAEVHADSRWRNAVADANRRKAKDLHFQQIMHTAMQKMHSDPEYIKTQVNSAQRMASNPEWQVMRATMNRQLAADPPGKRLMIRP